MTICHVHFKRLLAWLQNPELLEEEDRPSPSTLTLMTAHARLNALCDAQRSPPNRILPGIDGEVIFEWRSGALFESHRILERSVEILEMQDGKITSQRNLAHYISDLNVENEKTRFPTPTALKVAAEQWNELKAKWRSLYFAIDEEGGISLESFEDGHFVAHISSHGEVSTWHKL